MTHTTEDWTVPADWEAGWDEFRVPPTEDLKGKTLRVRFSEDGLVVDYSFATATSLMYRAVSEDSSGHQASVVYDASKIAERIYFVDYTDSATPAEAVSLIIDLETGQVLLVRVTLPDLEVGRSSFYDRILAGGELSSVTVAYMHGALVSESADEQIIEHQRTDELVGKWISYRYTSNRVFEHVYFSGSRFAWQGVEGASSGMAEANSCDYFKLAENLYLLVWREVVYPMCGMSIINLNTMRTMGKQFGLNIVTGSIEGVKMGAFATVLGGKVS